ncbi:hypothetical protein, variant 1 [Aphanomyces invadans]|uniref:RING-type E3 ubiquitin transferase (cysteine targeting) n=1 Tax=Aphanomyces invadans TaxID=157072 RepID=A0A024TDU1_9STRA|nr:hypothetical protein, variant 1 [Aphanomyces invadans]ETV91487.1 hypothetical protein, variant 1 [Aphanomyces invadans]|eukprot:XP_008879939.1 hypothetical protein, variant 1 [Aphanomyces invadans]
MAARWRDEHGGAIECLAHLRQIVAKSSVTKHCHAISNLRVNKWDSTVLDSEILSLMKFPVKNMFAFCRPGLMEKFQPEIDASVLAMLFIFSVGMKKPTPGMALQNLTYATSCLTWRKTLPLFLFSVVIPYGWKRIHHLLLSQRWREDRTTEAEEKYQRFLTVLHRISTIAAVCQLLNHAAFFKHGQYRTLAERVVGMKLQRNKRSLQPRAITFEYMNRQLVWDGLVDFGMFVLPLVNWSRLWRAVKRVGYVTDSQAGARATGCPICMTTQAKTPYRTSCGHVYCYFCLQSSVAGNPEFACVACGDVFESSHRVFGSLPHVPLEAT